MADFALTCCSTADLPEQFFIDHDIQFAVFHLHINGNEYPDDLGKSIPFERFYEMMRQGAKPSTSHVNIDQYKDLMEPLLEAGKDVLHVTLSSGISGSFESAAAAAAELKALFPERKIYVVDSLCASGGYGLLMEYLAEMRERGCSIDECRDWAEENKLKVHHWVATSDLTSLLRGGRISAASFAVGSLLGICPIIDVNFEGKLVPRGKIRHKKKAFNELVNKMLALADNQAEYDGKCIVAHSDALEDAIYVRDLVEEKFPKLKAKVQITNIGTVIGSHTGPGTVVLFFMGSKRIG